MSSEDGWNWVWQRFHGLDPRGIGDVSGDSGATGILGTQGPPPGSSKDEPAPDTSRLGAAQNGQQDQVIDLSVPVLRYPDARAVVDPNTGKPYPAPVKMDVSANAQHAQSRKDDNFASKALWMLSQFAQGMPQDYQRPDGYLAARLHNDFIMDNRNVTAYNLGVVARRAGYSPGRYSQSSGAL